MSVTSSSKYSSNTTNAMLETYKLILHELLIKDRLSDINYTTKDDINLFKQINKTETQLKHKDIKEALEKNDLEDIKAKKEKLQETAMAFATKVYEEAAKANQANEESESSDSDKKDDVQEAEFEEK